MQTIEQKCTYNAPVYGGEKHEEAKTKSFPVLGRDADYPLSAEIRPIDQPGWGVFVIRNKKRVCDLISSDIDEIRNASGVQMFDERFRGLRCDTSLYRPLKLFIDNTSYFSREYGPGLGDIAVLGHGGGIRTRDGDPSFHYVLKAIDIYWIGWNGRNGPVATRPCNGAEEVRDPSAHRRMVAIEAGLRKWFSYVLNRNIRGHHNHFHVDNGCEGDNGPSGIGLRIREGSSRWAHTSCHFFIQDCVNAFTDMQIGYDGTWGTDTKAGYATLLSDLGMERLDPKTNLNEYLLFLDYIMMHGFADARAGHFRWEGGTLHRPL